MHRVRVSILGFLVCCSAAAVTRSVWDSVYTKEQAARGLAVYQEACLKCHGEDMGGGESGPTIPGHGDGRSHDLYGE